MNTSGKRKIVKTVRGKRGVIRRSYWVSAGNLAKRHGGKVAAAAAVAGAAYLAHKNRHYIGGFLKGAHVMHQLQQDLAAHSEKVLRKARSKKARQSLIDKGYDERVGFRQHLSRMISVGKTVGARARAQKNYGQGFNLTMRHADKTSFSR